MISPTPEHLRIAELEAQVEALEQALQQRSRELRAIQSLVCPHDLLLISRVAAGLPPLPRHFANEPDLWRETTQLTPADVEDVLNDVWGSLTAPAAKEDPTGS